MRACAKSGSCMDYFLGRILHFYGLQGVPRCFGRHHDDRRRIAATRSSSAVLKLVQATEHTDVQNIRIPRRELNGALDPVA